MRSSARKSVATAKRCAAACGLLFTLCALGLAQNIDSQQSAELRISPSYSTMLVGEQRTFALNGPDGRPIQGARWSIQGEAVNISDGDPPIATAVRPGKAILTAVLDNRAVTACVAVVEGEKLPVGAVRWTTDALPASAPVTISSNMFHSGEDHGPDVVTSEITPSGVVMRGFTSDGREMWRSLIKPSLVPPGHKEGEPVTVTVPPRKPIGALSADGSMIYTANLDRGQVRYTIIGPDGKVVSDYRFGTPPQSLLRSGATSPGLFQPSVTVECRSLRTGMTKQQVLQLFGPKVSLSRDQFEQNTWRIPGRQMDCVIDFDATGAVLNHRFVAAETQ